LNAEYFRLKAARCRRLASAISNPNEPAIASLFALAAGYEIRAEVLEAAAATDKREHQSTERM
jgi:hypothetical protein